MALEANAFADSGTEASFIKKGSGYARNPADLQGDIARTINCRLSALLAAAPANCTLPAGKTLTFLRNASFPELQFPNAQGVAGLVDGARKRLQVAIAEAAALNPDLPEDPRGKMSCEDISAETKAAAATPDANPPATPPDRVDVVFRSYATACLNAETAASLAEPVLLGEPNSLFDTLSKQIKQLRVDRAARALEGFRLAQQTKAWLKDIGSAQGPGPAETAIGAALAKLQDDLGKAKGAAKLAGLRALADKTDELLQIELTNAAGGASGNAKTATAGSATTTTTPASADGLTAQGQAIVNLVKKGATAIDAYRGKEPSARAQELIIARAVLTQQTEVAALEAASDETQLRLLIAKRDFTINEVHLLAEGGLYLTRTELGTEQTHLALVRLAAAWDTGRIEEEAIAYRMFAAQRDTAIRISASNAKNLQAVVLAATDQIVAYTKGGLTKEMIADTFAKLFIGGALLK